MLNGLEKTEMHLLCGRRKVDGILPNSSISILCQIFIEAETTPTDTWVGDG